MTRLWRLWPPVQLYPDQENMGVVVRVWIEVENATKGERGTSQRGGVCVAAICLLQHLCRSNCSSIIT